MTVYIGIIAYFIIVILLGLYSARKAVSMKQFMLAGRNVGPIATALNVAAADMSGWLMLALPGLVYTQGVVALMLPFALILGALVNWIVIAKRLRNFSAKLRAITIPDFFRLRLEDKTGSLVKLSSFVLVIFFLSYLSSSMIMLALAMSKIFSLNYNICILIGLAFVPVYLMLGGLSAMTLVDFFQALLMLFSLILIGTLSFVNVGSTVNVDFSNLYENFTDMISHLSWSVGYLGQLHILIRFMAIENVKNINKARNYHIAWMCTGLGFASLIGYLGTYYVPFLIDPDIIFIIMTNILVNKLVAGVCLAAVIAAIISSIGAQTLKIVSAISNDVLKSKSVNASRITIFIVMALASVIAVFRPASIMDLVSFAWSGVGAGFGPVLLACLYSKKVTKNACMYGMSASTILVVLSAVLGIAGNVTALAFIINISIIYVVSYIKPASNHLQEKFLKLNNEKV